MKEILNTKFFKLFYKEWIFFQYIYLKFDLRKHLKKKVVVQQSNITINSIHSLKFIKMVRMVRMDSMREFFPFFLKKERHYCLLFPTLQKLSQTFPADYIEMQQSTIFLLFFVLNLVSNCKCNNPLLFIFLQWCNLLPSLSCQ